MSATPPTIRTTAARATPTARRLVHFIDPQSSRAGAARSWAGRVPAPAPTGWAEWPSAADLWHSPAWQLHGHAPTMDDYAAVISMLNHTWFGSELAPETQERLAKLGEVKEFEADEVIVQEGEEGVEFGILISGRLALRMLVPERGSVTILSVEPGDVFGWSAVLADARSQSTVVATQAGQALVIPGPKLRAALKEDHALAASLYPRVLQAVARRLHATRMQLLDLFAR
jgi:CRP/FNR family cyclic AMP-dependent transcriptional regulator